jgi:TetR/AcrR family transcriptional repressor of nem operon
VAEVMAAAGFTHGGFYNHFTSKEALATAASAACFAGPSDPIASLPWLGFICFKKESGIFLS